MEEKERQFLEAVKKEFDKSGGANGIDHNVYDPILKMPLAEKQEFFKRLIREKKIIQINHLNGISFTLPK
ncbi:hypothetical protein ACR1PO_15655 [Chryseobacterium sp. RRHN12]|uniref:hypothetical protein n=1 Tax=Chryseobacterium sp. RRHN12 TaxID=3437884 RepID=UPI003D9AC95B